MSNASHGNGELRTVIARDGTILSFLSVGKGPGVIVLPGVLSMASDYSAFAAALADNFTVHTLERRGQGRSGRKGRATLFRQKLKMFLHCSTKQVQFSWWAIAMVDMKK